MIIVSPEIASPLCTPLSSPDRNGAPPAKGGGAFATPRCRAIRNRWSEMKRAGILRPKRILIVQYMRRKVVTGYKGKAASVCIHTL